MRHANPSAVTLLLSAFPRMEAAAQAILLQADEILVKPVNIPSLVDAIQHRSCRTLPYPDNRECCGDRRAHSEGYNSQLVRTHPNGKFDYGCALESAGSLWLSATAVS